MVLGIALLTIQWVLVPLPLLGAQRVSVAGVMVVSGVAVLGLRNRVFVGFLRTTWPFVIGMAALTVVRIAVDVFHGDPVRVALNQGVQLAIFVCVGTAVLACCRSPRGIAALRWTGVVCNVLLLAALYASLTVNQVSPLGVLGQTVVSGDPNVLQAQLFRFGLVGFGFEAEDLLSNVRHEIFAGVLVSTLLAEAARHLMPFRSRAAHLVTRASLVVTLVLITLSLSRSIILAALVWPALAAVRAFQRQELPVRQLLAGVVALVGAVVAVVLGFAAVLLTRFTEDTTSYDLRGGLIEEALRNIASEPLLGGFDTQGESSHNFILDSWLRTGLVGALLALAVTMVLVLLTASVVLRLGDEPTWMIAVGTLLALALLRMFTAGGGALPPVAWVALAVAGGLMAYRAEREPPSVPGGAAGPVTAGSARLAASR